MATTLLFFSALWLVLWRHLSGEWSVNDQYSYGWFVPFFGLFLSWLRWEDKPQVEFEIRNSKFDVTAVAAVAVSLLLLLPLRLFEIGNPDWRPLGWIHAAVVVTLTLLYIRYGGGTPWLRHFAFPVAFIFVAVPWVTPIEAPVIQGLMRVIAAAVSEALNLFGVATQVEGNLIRVSSGLVGVNEACSGVRSLQTSLMIGLLFGEVKRLSIARRAVLVASAVAIAIVANFCRAFFLVWIAATKNVSTIQHWHDFAGYSIVAVVFLGSLVLASFLGRMKREVRDQMSEVGLQNLLSLHVSAPRQHHESNFEFPRLSFLICASVWLVAVELASTLWYRAHENNFVANTSWTVHWPENAPDLHVLKLDEEVRRTLRFDEGEAASWDCPPRGEVGPLNRFGVAGPARVTCFGYFFHWKSGRNSALLANLHRPDVCLPAIGWRQVADNGIRQYPTVGSLRLPFRHFEFRHGTNGYPTQQVAHAFYCLWEDRAPGTITASQLPQMTSAPSTWTRRERLRVVLEGRRHLGQRVMEVVLHSRSLIDQNEAEASFAALLPRLIVLKPAESH